MTERERKRRKVGERKNRERWRKFSYLGLFFSFWGLALVHVFVLLLDGGADEGKL